MAHVTEPVVRSRHVWLPVAGGAIDGDLSVPDRATGIVLFAHGSGSSRLSPRNRKVARELQDGGLATLLFDLLTPMEEEEDKRTGQLRFDVKLLADRLVTVIDLVAEGLGEGVFRIGLFGASTGSAAALIAAAKRPKLVRAIVSRGGRPDLAESALASVRAPTLLIVGAQDPQVLQLNMNALAQLKCIKRMEVVPRATHLFAEAGTLEQVSWLARDWFNQHLSIPTYS
jgi:putative phosphoribosyl transferase